jgi:hypothetical protein
MKYLLLNGQTTSNLNTYLRDVLFLNFKTLPSEIPFNTQLGLKRYILEDSVMDYIDRLRSSVVDLMERLNNRHSTRLELTDISLKGDEVIIQISMEDQTIESYSVPTLTT